MNIMNLQLKYTDVFLVILLTMYKHRKNLKMGEEKLKKISITKNY